MGGQCQGRLEYFRYHLGGTGRFQLGGLAVVLGADNDVDGAVDVPDGLDDGHGGVRIVDGNHHQARAVQAQGGQ
ncbi:hypothetical protein D3C84_416080 [compost metagenome]